MMITKVYSDMRLSVDPTHRRVKIYPYSGDNAAYWDSDGEWHPGLPRHIARHVDHDNYTFYGQIDECVMYDHVLTPDEVDDELKSLQGRMPGCVTALREVDPQQLIVYKILDWVTDKLDDSVPNNLIAIFKHEIDPMCSAILKTAVSIESISPVESENAKKLKVKGKRAKDEKS